MTQEDKLKEAKRLYQTANADQKYVLESLFPELQESEDEKTRKEIIIYLKSVISNKKFGDEIIESWIDWLEKQGEQKSADEVEQKGMNIVEEDMTPFQKKVFCIIDTTIEEEQGLKQVCDELLRLAHDEIMQKPTWSEEDEKMINYITIDIEELIEQNAYDKTQLRKEIDWLKSLKDRVQPQPKQEWSEEDENTVASIISSLSNPQLYPPTIHDIEWLKSLLLRSIGNRVKSR